jgi:hypothetical protein
MNAKLGTRCCDGYTVRFQPNLTDPKSALCTRHSNPFRQIVQGAI